jgi:Calcineurin-like phosphoesterase
MQAPSRAGLAACLALLAACTSGPSPAPDRIAAGNVLHAYTLLAQRPRDGRTTVLARVVVDGADQPCPTLSPGAIAMVPRTNPNPSTFDVTVCEAVLAFGQTLRVGDTGPTLPAVAAEARRIVVVGDTGCYSGQGCSDPATWPFGAFAAAAAEDPPDLVVHVGDYNYRGTPGTIEVDGEKLGPYNAGDGLPPPQCLNPVHPYVSQNVPGRSAWDSWQTWRDDFFLPAEPLLAAGPWVFARGNHELCSRAGPGYFYFLDPHSELLGGELSCPVQQDGDDPLPYVVFVPPERLDLGPLDLVVLDTANACDLSTNYPTTYARQFDSLRALLDGDEPAWLVTHRPLWGVEEDAGQPGTFQIISVSLQQALRHSSPNGSLPRSVQVVLAGHMHQFQSATFAPESGRPPQVIVGNSGVALTNSPLSGASTIALDGERAKELTLIEFGYLELTVQADGSWRGHIIDPRSTPPEVLVGCGTAELKAKGEVCLRPAPAS